MNDRMTEELVAEDAAIETALDDVEYYKAAMPAICRDRRRELLRNHAAVRAELERRKGIQ